MHSGIGRFEICALVSKRNGYAKKKFQACSARSSPKPSLLNPP